MNPRSDKQSRYGQKAASLLSLLIFVFPALPALAQSTVLTGKVERSQTRVQVPARASLPAAAAAPMQAQAVRTVVVERPVYRNVYIKDNRTFWQKHPKVKAATIGAGVGAGAGAVTGLIARRGVVRGAAIGAGTGAGVGLVRSSETMKRHPIIKDVSTGTLVGLGIGAAAGRRGGALKGAGVGAAVGLGASLLKNGLR